MPWDLGLPLLVALATLILSFGIFWSAKTLLFDARRGEGTDSGPGEVDGGARDSPATGRGSSPSVFSPDAGRQPAGLTGTLSISRVSPSHAAASTRAGAAMRATGTSVSASQTAT